MSDGLDSKVFHVLVSLADGPNHGYAIRQEVEERTGGAVRLWPASLYGTLAELVERGWSREAEPPAGPEDDARRRYYELTEAGREALAAEASRLEGMVRLARRNLSRGEATA